MLDVLHFLLEEDMVISSQEESESRSVVREAVYRELYGVTYKYGSKNTRSRSMTPSSTETYDDLDAELSADIDPFSPRAPQTKPYTPPTRFDPTSSNPFEGILDAPL